MYRFGFRDMHHYFLGSYTTKEKAVKEAEAEKEYRGGSKYYPEIFEFEINKSKTGKVVYKLKQNPHFSQVSNG